MLQSTTEERGTPCNAGSPGKTKTSRKPRKEETSPLRNVLKGIRESLTLNELKNWGSSNNRRRDSSQTMLSSFNSSRDSRLLSPPFGDDMTNSDVGVLLEQGSSDFLKSKDIFVDESDKKSQDDSNVSSTRTSLQARHRSSTICSLSPVPRNRQLSAVVRRTSVIPAPISPDTVSTLICSEEFDDLHLPHNSAPMSRHFPTTNDTQVVFLRYGQVETELDTFQGLIVEDGEGELLATLEYDTSKQRRILRDSRGHRCSTIQHSVNSEKQHCFKICCSTQMTPDHRRSNESGLFTWGEVKNTGGIGAKFSMKMRRHEANGPRKFVTESFGSSLFKSGSAKGFLIHQDNKPCARITTMGEKRGLVVGPNVDLCLMISFASVIGEMVDRRLR